MSPSVHIRLSAEILVRICEAGALERGGGIITFVVSEEFPSSVNGGSEGGNFEFLCVGKEVCTVLFSVSLSLFQGFTLLV